MTVSNEAVEAALDSYNATTPGVRIRNMNAMRAALEAAAPYMLFAPEGVSEAEKDLSLLLTEYEEIRDVDTDFANAVVEFCSHRIAEHFPLIRQALGALSALSSERERAERAERIRDQWHSTSVTLATEATKYVARAQAAEAKVKELEAPFDWTAEDLVDLMAEAIMDAIDMDTNATDYARAALIALNKEGLLRPNDYREPQQ